MSGKEWTVEYDSWWLPPLILQFEGPAQGITSYPFPFSDAQHPAGQSIQHMDSNDPPIHVNHRLQIIVRQRSKVYLCISLPYHVCEQSYQERHAEPQEAYKTRREPKSLDRRTLSSRVWRIELDLGIKEISRKVTLPPISAWESVWLACPPGGREQPLRVRQRSSQADVPLVGEEDKESNGNGHRHDDKCPSNP